MRRNSPNGHHSNGKSQLSHIEYATYPPNPNCARIKCYGDTVEEIYTDYQYHVTLIGDTEATINQVAQFRGIPPEAVVEALEYVDTRPKHFRTPELIAF